MKNGVVSKTYNTEVVYDVFTFGFEGKISGIEIKLDLDDIEKEYIIKKLNM